MRRIKRLILTKNTIVRSLNDNKYNLIITRRGWGLTTLLINYINKIPHDKKVFFGVSNSNMVRSNISKITHPNCKIQKIHHNSFIGCSFDYIICDNFFDGNWIQKLVLISPVLTHDGKIILAYTNEQFETSNLLYFANYNKIIKTKLN